MYNNLREVTWRRGWEGDSGEGREDIDGEGNGVKGREEGE